MFQISDERRVSKIIMDDPNVGIACFMDQSSFTPGLVSEITRFDIRASPKEGNTVILLNSYGYRNYQFDNGLIVATGKKHYTVYDYNDTLKMNVEC